MSRVVMITIVGLTLSSAGVTHAQSADVQARPAPVSSPEPGWSAAEPPAVEPNRPVPGLGMIWSGAAVSLVGLGYGAGAVALYADTLLRKQRCYDRFSDPDLASLNCEGAMGPDGWPVVGSLVLGTAAAHLLVGVPLIIAGSVAASGDEPDEAPNGEVTLLLSPSAVGLRVTY